MKNKNEIGNSFLMFPQYGLKDIHYIHMMANRLFGDRGTLRANQVLSLAEKYEIEKGNPFRSFAVNLFYQWLIFGGENKNGTS